MTMHPLLARIRNIVADPRREWPLIATESGDPARLLVGYVALLAAIPAISAFIGSSLVGVSVSAGRVHDSIPFGLLRALVSYLFSFVIVYLTALVIDVLAPMFNTKRNFGNALKLAVYSYTPVWLIGIVLIVPGLRFLAILGLYAIRLLWTGLPPLMGTPRPKILPYALSIVVAAFGITLAMSVIQAAMLSLPFRD
ncbi:Yip1 family protein [Pseudorhodoplanes sp.]|uniref:Yip1 family protein n=1 Tax=Pseudorhodoplanes sp. TaxID=1934341 RepID=UPI002CC3B6B7|nr:Yip1 family protein [Pseudorhodoplanes sp.]HWV42939.1 Yip1 family protein [Pseudorhodoplanes sp.]